MRLRVEFVTFESTLASRGTRYLHLQMGSINRRVSRSDLDSASRVAAFCSLCRGFIILWCRCGAPKVSSTSYRLHVARYGCRSGSRKRNSRAKTLFYSYFLAVQTWLSPRSLLAITAATIRAPCSSIRHRDSAHECVQKVAAYDSGA